MSPLGPSPGVLACAVAVTNFGWWTNFKLLALSAGRGQLAECSSLPAFLAVGALPIRLSDKRAREGVRRGERAEPVAPAEHFFLALLKLSLLAACVVLIPRTPEASAARCLAQSFALYAVLGAVMDVSSLVAAGVFDLHLAPHFDKPFLAASISEFWAERWNLVAGAMLRDLVYAPSSAAPSTRPRPRPRRDPSRRLVYLTLNLTSFARPPPPSRVSPRAAPRTSASSGTWSVLRVASTDDGRCFSRAGARRDTRRAARRSRRLAAVLGETPRAVAVAVALGAQFALANALFFPPVAETGLDERVREDVRRLLFRK